MRKIYVDIFYCERSYTKKAIGEYLQEVIDLGGIVCPSVVLLGEETITPISDIDAELPEYRIFSIQRKPGNEVKVVVNLSVRVNQ